MNEDTKKLIWEITIMGIATLVIVFLIGSLINGLNKDREQYRQKNIQEINECFEKTNDKDWCLNKFLR